MLKKLVIVVAAVVVSFAATNAQAEKVLRWKLTPGQKLRAQLSQQIVTTTAFTNKPVNLAIDITLEMSWIVDSVEEGKSAKVTQTFDSVSLKMTVPPSATVEYDSRNPKKPTGEAKELAAMVAPLLNAEFVTTFSPRGEILDVSIPEKTAAALANAGSGGGQSYFTKDRINHLLRQSAAVLPEKGINVGDKWEETATIDSPLGKLKQVSTYTYEGDEDRNGAVLEKIGVASQIELPAPDPNAVAPVLKEQSLSGVIYFNSTAGRVVESQVTQKMKTDTKVRENIVSANATSTLKTIFSTPTSP